MLSEEPDRVGEPDSPLTLGLSTIQTSLTIDLGELVSTVAAGNTTEAAILARLLKEASSDLTSAVAEYFLSVGFGDADRARMDVLSEKASLGMLAASEQTELDSYIHVSNMLALMQSKARRKLAAL